jgi:hypothetical protein
MSSKIEETEDVLLVIEPEGASDEAPVSELVEAVLEAQEAREALERDRAIDREAQRIDGIVIGRVVQLGERGPVVRYRGCPSPDGLVARATAMVTVDDVGRRAALMFENGDAGKPILTGLLHYDEEEPADHPALGSLQITEDEQKIDIKVKKAISLSCGKASLIITPAGKILLRGKYVLTRASGVNRLQGGSVRIN